MSEELLQEETQTMADFEEHFDDANPWNLIASYKENGTVLPVKVEGIVNGGAIAMVEGIRGFIPASRLSLSYIENLESYLLKDIEVKVIEADQAENRLVLSAREILKEKENRNCRNLTELRRIYPSPRQPLRTGTCITDQPEACKTAEGCIKRRR